MEADLASSALLGARRMAAALRREVSSHAA
jgi:hypothetical protein